jgi:hypothetical protein
MFRSFGSVLSNTETILKLGWRINGGMLNHFQGKNQLHTGDQDSYETDIATISDNCNRSHNASSK